MRSIDLLTTAVANLGRHKLRTTLTVAGVTIGTTALALMISIAAGVQAFAVEQTQAMMANDLVYVTNSPDVGSMRINVGQIGAPAEEVKEDRTAGPRAKPISPEQIAQLRALPHVRAVYPNLFFNAESIKLVGAEKAYRVRVSPAYPGSRTVQLVAGLGFSGAEREVVLSNQYLTVFAFADPAQAIGRSVLLTFSRPALSQPGRQFVFGQGPKMEKEQFRARIVGITVKTADATMALVPFDYALEMARWQARDRQLFSPHNFGYTGIVQVDAPQQVDPVAASVRATGMGALTPADQLGMLNTIFLYIEGVLSIVGLIALAVASLGIGNTLVMAIYERTREIGIWKAVGAPKRTIRLLFTVEAGTIGLAGGLVGVLLAWALGQAINALARATFARDFASFALSAFPPLLVLAVLAFSTLIGVIAGLLPANRAAELDPVAALRHE